MISICLRVCYKIKECLIMEILDNKYISEDEIREIALNTDPKDIFKLCSINKKMKSICKSKNFWSKYVDNKQERYKQLLFATASQGNVTLWEQIWSKKVPEGVIAEPRLLMPAFEIAVKKGNEELADYIWLKYSKWKNIDPKELENEKFIIILKSVIQFQDLDFSLDLLKEWSENNYYHDWSKIGTAFAYSPSYKFLIKLLKFVKYNFYSSNSDYSLGLQKCINTTFGEATLQGNLPIIYGLLDRISLGKSTIIYLMLGSYSSKVLEVLNDRFPDYFSLINVSRAIGSDNYGSKYFLRNKKIIKDFIYRSKSKKEQELIALFTPLAFKPYEFIEFLTENGLCYTPLTIERVDRILEREGEYYRKKILDENAPLCRPV